MSNTRERACAVVLAGGAGTRIRHLYPDLPKPLITVAGRPVMQWICDFWVRQGVRQLVLSLGHHATVAERAIAQWSWPGVEVICVREETPLGTAGALRFAVAAVPHADPLVVLNGDSLLAAPLGSVWRLLENPEIDGVVVGVEAPDTSRFGRLRMDRDGFLMAFEEKQRGAGWINAGIYIFRRRLLSLFPTHNPLSIEYDLFPAFLGNGCRLQVLRTQGDFIDIGTPEALAVAEDFVRRNARELSE